MEQKTAEVKRMYRGIEIRSNGDAWEVWHNGKRYYKAALYDACTDFVDDMRSDILAAEK